MTTCLIVSLLTFQPVPESRVYRVDGVERRADIYAPTVASALPPLVFGFHGHGGNTRNAARSFRMHELWPEAVVVYMQGLPTVSAKVDPKGQRPGWQNQKGQYEDRDLAFFDAVYADVTRRLHVDKDRVYAMGHSNGGRFTYLLMQQRGDVFAAFGPSGSPSHLVGMPAKPVFHVAGEKDPLVKFEGQRRSLDLVKQRNGCTSKGVKTGEHTVLFKGKDGNDVVAYFHPGGHEYPRDVPPLLLKFFMSHRK